MAGLEAAEAGAEAEAWPEVAAGADGEPPAGAAQAATINAATATMAQRPRPVCRPAPVASERVARDGFCPIDGPSSGSPSTWGWTEATTRKPRSAVSNT